MNFFAEIFYGLASLSTKLPSVPVGAYFIVVLLALVVAGVAVGFSYLGNAAGKMKRSIKKTLGYLKLKSEINEDNVGDFTYTCFGNSSPRALREAWVKYLGVRFGYPSDIMSENDVFDREVKKASVFLASIFIGVALILIGFFAFWGMSLDNKAGVGVIICAGLLLSGIIYLVLVWLSKKQYTSTRELFYELQDELDAKVDLQVEKDFSTDASPLYDMTAMIDDIIARNTAKVVDIPKEEFVPDENIGRQNENLDEKSAAENAVDENASLDEESNDKQPQKENSEIAKEPASKEETESGQSAEEQPAEEAIAVEPLAEEAIAVEPLAEEAIAEFQEPESEEEDLDNNEETTDDISLQDDALVAEETTDDTIINATEEVAEDLITTDNNSQFAAQAEEAVIDDAPFRRIENDAEQNIDSLEENVDIAEFNPSKSASNFDKEDGVGDWLIANNEFNAASKSEPFEEENREDEEDMFGKKKKEREEAEALAATAIPAKPAREYADSEIFLDSEVIVEETPASSLKEVETAPAAAAEPAPTVEPAKQVEIKPEIAPIAPVAAETETIEEDEDLEEVDEEIKAPKLSKLPHLVDYVISMNVSRGIKIKVAMLVMQAYKAFKDSPENKAICIQCLGKIMSNLKAKA